MFFRYLWKKKWFILLFIIMCILSSSVMASISLYTKTLFDNAQLTKFNEVLWGFVMLFIWFIVAKLLEHYSDLTGIHVINVIRKDIKNDLFSAAIIKQLPDYADKNAGEYIAEFTNDITIIENKFLSPCKDLVSFVITIIATGVAIFTINVNMAIVLLVGVALCLGLPFLLTKYTSGKMMKFLIRFDNFVQHLKDLFGAFFTFKNYAVENKVIDKFQTENASVEKVKFNAEMSIVVTGNLIGRLASLLEVIVVLIGLIGVANHTLTVGDVFAAMILANSISTPLHSFSGRIGTMRSVKSIENKFKQIGVLEEKIKHDVAIATNPPEFDIKIENVSLDLKGNEVLNDVSFEFEHGKKYLILGGNGSGKSTVAKLLKCNYRNYTGEVKLGECSLNTPEGAGLSRAISYSNETVALISDSIKNNVLLYRNVSDERLEKAVKMAELNVILDRMVGDNGKFLSSGERRKLEIARALIEEPNVMILDEVVSTLDIETAYEIENLVLSFENRTIIMISNAFSGKLLEKYDKIFMMKGGKVIASGTHSEMLNNCADYREAYTLRCTPCQEEVQ